MQKLTHFRPEDVLTDMLRSVHVQGTLYCRSKMSMPWGFRVARRDTASFHVVTEGQCWLDIEGVVTGVLLNTGDLVILPHGHAHTMRNPPNTLAAKIEYLDDLVAKLAPDEYGMLRYGRKGAPTTALLRIQSIGCSSISCVCGTRHTPARQPPRRSDGRPGSSRS